MLLTVYDPTTHAYTVKVHGKGATNNINQPASNKLTKYYSSGEIINSENNL